MKPQTSRPSVTVIATVKNEGASIKDLLDSLLQQTQPPDEIVIVDGGSTDDTVHIIQSHLLSSSGLLRLLIQKGANISQGRNIAIAAACGEVIAATDAGVRLSREWLAELMRPFEELEPPPDVVSGFFLPDPRSAFEVAMGATVLPTVNEIVAERFNPSSRSVAFRKAAWAKVGGYPEWLDYCEDLIFDFKLREAGFRFHFAPRAVVYFRPRPSLGAFFKQYYRYARGDGKADIWRKRHAVRYLTYFLALPLLLIAGFISTPLWWLLLLAGGIAMLWMPYKRLLSSWDHCTAWEKVQAALWVPVIRVTGDLAKMVGYPVGLWWRWRYRSSIPN